MDLVVPSATIQPQGPLGSLLTSVRALRRICATTMNASLAQLPRGVEADLIAEVDAARARAEPLDTTRLRAMVDEARRVLELLPPADGPRVRRAPQP